MSKYTFINAGYVSLQKHLYALNDQDLKAEAALISTLFNQWMEAHFDLSKRQVLFIERIDARITQLLAYSFYGKWTIGNSHYLLKTGGLLSPILHGRGNAEWKTCKSSIYLQCVYASNLHSYEDGIKNCG